MISAFPAGVDGDSRRETASGYDVIVVGAGIGGLTAAALAARAGARVLVVEAHNRPGGCAGDFAMDGLLFPAGATLLSGFEPGGLHDVVYRALDIPHRAVPLERSMDVVTTEGRFPLWTDRDRWDDTWRRVFPGQERGKQRFFAWSERVGGVVHRMAARLPVLPPRAPKDAMRLARALRPDVLATTPYLTRTVGGVLRSTGVTDRRFTQFIDAQLLDATGCMSGTAAAVNGAIALDLYHRGCFTLPGGTAEVARDLLRSLRRDGGAIVYDSVVVGLRRDGEDGWTVRTASGRTYRTRGVIANVPVWDLAPMLAGTVPPRLRRAKRLQSHGWGAVLLHAAVGTSVFADHGTQYAQVLPSPGRPLTDGEMCFITVLPPRPGAQVRAVSVSTHTRTEQWWGLDAGAYEEQKAAQTALLIDACERAFPGFKAGTRWMRTATPRTFAHYTLRTGGLVGGLRNDLRHSLFCAPSHRTGLAGLYLCGDTVFPGQGTIGVTLSGINAWRTMRDHLGGGRRLAAAGGGRPVPQGRDEPALEAAEADGREPLYAVSVREGT